MLPATNRGAGQNLGFPDTCNTPQPTGTVPIPYPNIAMHVQATDFSEVVRISMMNALHQSSKIPMTNGDEAGVAHSNFMKEAAFTTGNPIVNIENKPAINLACPTTGNNKNCGSALVAVPSVTTVSFTMRPPSEAGQQAPRNDGYRRMMSTPDLERLSDAMRAPAVSGRWLADGVAYLAIAAFSSTVSTLVFRTIRRLGVATHAALVLDLRGNPGGDTNAMLRLADDFLPRDTILLRQLGDDGDELVRRARQDDPYRFALVVLVDGGTASAAELFAGCLQSHGRAVLIGERTYGKGAMQRLVPAMDGPGMFYQSVARCRLPNGNEVQGRGIEPDELVAGTDAQLERARAIASRQSDTGAGL